MGIACCGEAKAESSNQRLDSFEAMLPFKTLNIVDYFQAIEKIEEINDKITLEMFKNEFSNIAQF